MVWLLITRKSEPLHLGARAAWLAPAISTCISDEQSIKLAAYLGLLRYWVSTGFNARPALKKTIF